MPLQSNINLCTGSGVQENWQNNTVRNLLYYLLSFAFSSSSLLYNCGGNVRFIIYIYNFINFMTNLKTMPYIFEEV